MKVLYSRRMWVMKHSIFQKLAIGLMIVLLLIELIMLIIVYNTTYDNTVKEATKKIQNVANYEALNFETYELNNKEDMKNCSEEFTRMCNLVGVTYIYAIQPDIENRSETYLATGYGNGASKEFVYNRYPGYVAKGYLRDEQIQAFKGDDSGIVLHEKNAYDDTLICYMPVKRYFDYNTSTYVQETTCIIGVEISIDTIMASFNARVLHTIIMMLVFSFVLVIAFSIVMYFRISKPIRRISKRMKSFVSQRDEEFVPLQVKGSDELADMSQSFNVMAQEIDRYLLDVTELNRQKAELNIARTIQMGLLEPQSFHNGTVTVNAFMLPARDVGGDFYDYLELDNGDIFVAIADVSGKGITAALFMARAFTMLHQYAESGLSPARILYEYNNHLAKNNPNMMFITTFVAVYHPSTGELIYANGGHNPSYILSDTLIKADQEHDLAAGIFTDVTYEEYRLVMKPGEMLFIYTDGVTEAQNKKQELFGEEKLEEVLADSPRNDGEATIKTVLNELREFTDDNEQVDDITMLTLEIPLSGYRLLKLPAKKEQLIEINQALEQLNVSDDVRFALQVMAEEVFVNICSYAYPDSDGMVEIKIQPNKDRIIMTFTDSGIPFDTTENVIHIEDYDTENAVGGLGRFLTFSLADNYSYNRIDNKNILTISKNTDEA